MYLDLIYNEAIANNIIDKIYLTLEYYNEQITKIEKQKKNSDEKEINIKHKLDTTEKLMSTYEVKFYSCEKEKVID